jgi:hypothetical protein
VNELISVGLLTPTEEAKCHESDSANVLVIEGETAPDILSAAGFVEPEKGHVNWASHSISILAVEDNR